ncbi:hypothetical protein [Pseudochryseolinea flava]|uniref:hypothetical protein n=1 Tax=Pseudochryseolinea flava TaxID=2059302 RepID=UPI001057835C|nr:hypothetical protein [Pseudochryseolinea flava]
MMAAVAIWTVLALRLLYGLVKRKADVIKETIKYILNTVSFLFVYAVYSSFSIVVRAPHGKTKDDSIKMLNDWVRQESFDWSLSALLLTALLILFNIVYQLKVEKVKDNGQIILLTISSGLIMAFGIFLGSSNALVGLTEEINRHTY